MVKVKTRVASLVVKSGKEKFIFPFAFNFPKAKARNVKYALKRKKGEYNSVTVADRLKELHDCPKWTKTVNHWKREIEAGRKGKPKRQFRLKFAYVKVRDITIDDDIQRDLDPQWVASIFNTDSFDEVYMAAIQCVYDTTTGKMISINSQHTLTGETGFAFDDLWELDPVLDADLDMSKSDWYLDIKVPVTYFEVTSRAKARMGFRYLNGKNQKRVGPYQEHKILVLSKRVDDSTELDAIQADELQVINETEGFEPVDAKSEYNDQPWAITCVDEMMSHYTRPKRWEFVLRTHKRYWPNDQLAITEVDLYGFIYDYFSVMKGADVYSESFNKQFLDPAMALVQEIFDTPKAFDADCAKVQARYHAKKLDRSVDSKEVISAKEAMGPFVYLLKLYQRFNGTHKLPDVVDNFNEKRTGDLLDYVTHPDLLAHMEKVNGVKA